MIETVIFNEINFSEHVVAKTWLLVINILIVQTLLVRMNANVNQDFPGTVSTAMTSMNAAMVRTIVTQMLTVIILMEVSVVTVMTVSRDPELNAKISMNVL